MRKYIIALLCLLGVAMPSLADNVISVSSASGQPGDEVEVTLSLQNTDDIVAAEVLIPLDKQVQYVEGSAVLNSERSDNHTLSASGADNELRLYVFSLTNKPLKGNSGTLATFRLKLGRNPECLQLTPKVVLSAANGSSLASNTEVGGVTILAPQLTIVNSTVDYGHVPIRSTYNQNLTLTNSGTSSLHVSDIIFSAAELSAADRTFVIEPGDVHTLTVNFAPTKHGAISEKATIMSDAVNEENVATIIADPFSVNELHSGSAEGNSDTEVSVDVTLNNMEPIAAAQWTYTLPDALKYVEGSVMTGSHASGLSVSAFVTGKKLTIIMYSHSNNVIPEGDGCIASFRLNLQGQSGTYYLTPSEVILGNVALQNMVSASSGGSVRIMSPRISSNATLSMPKCPVTETVSQSYSISNYGQADMEISRVAFLNENFSIAEELPITISPYETKDVTVVYQPKKSGSYSTTMMVYTNDPETRMKSVAVSGTTFEPNDVSMTGEWSGDKRAYITHIAVENYTQLVAAQMDIHLPEGASINVANALSNTSRLAGMTSSLAKIDDMTYRLLVFSMNNMFIQGNNGDILSLTFNVEDASAIGEKQIVVDNILLSNISGKNYSSTDVVTVTIEAPAEESILKGDVNGDGEVGLVDLVTLIDVLLGKAKCVDLTKCDINKDGQVNMTDVSALTNIILGK